MTPRQMEAMRAKLSRMTGKTVIVRNTVDPSVLGGVVLRYAGKQFDGSVKARLDALEKSLKEIVL